MGDIKWIKVTTDIFDDEKILLIESLPEADSIIVIWFKLLCLAGKMNNSGVFMMNDKIPYTDKMLATIFRRKEATVQLALQTFEQFGMIQIIDDVITIPNWGKHQNLDQLENKRDYQRQYMRDYRKKQAEIACKTNSKTNSKTNVSDLDKEREIDIDKEIDKERDREKEKDLKTLIVSNDTICQTDVRQVIEKWNELQSFGIVPVSKISPDSKRYKSLVARIRQFGIDDVCKAIDNVKDSPWLLGQNKDGWMITLDWFALPTNFQKVFDGNYIKKATGISERDIVNEWRNA